MQHPAPHHHLSAARAVVGPSLLRLSVMQRLAIAAASAAFLWAAVAWALLGSGS
jgi:hypothetical protein